MAGPAGGVVGMEEAEVRFLSVDLWVSSTLGKVDAAAVVAGRPARSFPTDKGQRNYPGLLWTATTGSLVGYESLLKRDRLWLADFDPAVRAIFGQPFWLTGPTVPHFAGTCPTSSSSLRTAAIWSSMEARRPA